MQPLAASRHARPSSRQAGLKEEHAMKRFHVHVAVSDLSQSIRFYETLFGVPPTVAKDDYAKWMLDDPRVNFAISSRSESAAEGIDHLGIQVDDERELASIDARLKEAEQTVPQSERCPMLLRPLRQGVEHRSFGPVLGNLSHAWRDHDLWHRPRRAPKRQRLLRAEAGARRGTGRIVLLRLSGGGRHAESSIQRHVSLYRQFGTQHPGGIDSQSSRRGALSRLQRGKLSQERAAPLRP